MRGAACGLLLALAMLADGAMLAESPKIVVLEPPPNGGGGLLAGLLAMATRVLFYAGMLGLIGALAFRVMVLAPLARVGEDPAVLIRALAWSWQIAATSLSALLLAVPLRLWVQLRTLFPDDPFGNVSVLTTQTVWGGGWWMHAGAGFVAAAGIWLARPLGQRARGWVVISLGVLLLPFATAVSGHAWAAQPRGLAVGALYVHVLAAGTWAGGLYCLVFAGLRALRTHALADGLSAVTGGLSLGLVGMVAAFSRVAVVAVACLVATGTANAWLNLDDFTQLWTTPWGRALMLKAGLAGAAIAVGFYNWRVVRPALAENPRPGRLERPAQLELALGAAVLLATSWLAVQSMG